jgi:hypothetical protein
VKIEIEQLNSNILNPINIPKHLHKVSEFWPLNNLKSPSRLVAEPRLDKNPSASPPSPQFNGLRLTTPDFVFPLYSVLSASILLQSFFSSKMSASSRIPPIAQPFVSEHAKRTLDLVTHSQYTHYSIGGLFSTRSANMPPG